MTFHYLLMAGHAIYLKQLMAELNHTGLTPGQPKVLDYLMEHDGANQKEMGREVTEAFARLEEYTFQDIPPEKVGEFMEMFQELYERMKNHADTGEPTK